MGPDGESLRILADCHRFAHRAMGAVFDIYVEGGDAEYAAQASREAFEELDRIEAELSRFDAASEVSRINRAAPRRPLRPGGCAFDCIAEAERIRDATGGAFDIAIASPAQSRSSPAAGDPHAGRSRLRLDARLRTVEWIEKSRLIDVGGIGKGFALDALARLLADWDLPAALLHGGRSTALACGSPDAAGWPIAIRRPAPPHEPIIRASLTRGAISGSGLRKGAHILDPRSGEPAAARVAAWSWSPTAAESDALSTAFLVMAPEETRRFCEAHPRSLAVVISASGEVTVVRGRELPISVESCAAS